MRQIVDVQLKQMFTQVESSRGISLHFSDKAKDALALLGFDEAYGARPLKRVIQKRVLDELAKRIIEGEVVDNSTVSVDYDGNDFIIKDRKAKK